MTVATAMTTRESCRAAFRPYMSLYMPITTPPTGRTTKAPPNTRK
eukprot:CAMPEP_0182578888 /NCGR_PEP_ID=MMETSP1324-20130603/42515_1 /TAXON_ID=236786 /ORGANISM="Florenciella sp., Strain RCC1587" /LENGTH=44 /DNA_ID= /DNA_START= /DNA_END= /DNA_ORIENTATION=